MENIWTTSKSIIVSALAPDILAPCLDTAIDGAIQVGITLSTADATDNQPGAEQGNLDSPPAAACFASATACPVANIANASSDNASSALHTVYVC